MGRRKPTIAPSTAGLRSVQATATAPAVVSCLSAGMEAYAHALPNWGARRIGHENTGNSPTLARRLAWRAGLAGGAAFLAVDLLMDALGWRVGAPGAAERFTMLTVMFTGDFVAALRANGLLALTAGENVLRLLPPLVVGEADIAEGLGILNKVAREWPAS